MLPAHITANRARSIVIEALLHEDSGLDASKIALIDHMNLKGKVLSIHTTDGKVHSVTLPKSVSPEELQEELDTLVKASDFERFKNAVATTMALKVDSATMNAALDSLASRLKGEPGEPGAPGEKGDAPTEEDIRPIVESVLPGAIEEAIRPLAPSVADSYPPHGDITLEGGKTLHLLSLDGEARISFPASGSPGASFILAIVRGAEHAIIPGRDKLASADSPRSLWLSVVHDGSGWLPAPGQDSSQTSMFDEAIENWKTKFHSTLIDSQNILDTIVEAAAWVRAFTETLVPVSDEMDLGHLDASMAGDSTGRAAYGDSAARYLYAQYQALVGVVQNTRLTTGFFEWMARNLIFGHREDVSYSFPPNGHSAVLHSDDEGAALILGDAYEVVGLDEGSPRLRVRIRPYADESYGEYRQGAFELTPHKHAGEVYEVPLVRVEEA